VVNGFWMNGVCAASVPVRRSWKSGTRQIERDWAL
jgi:hypothetical protein